MGRRRGWNVWIMNSAKSIRAIYRRKTRQCAFFRNAQQIERKSRRQV